MDEVISDFMDNLAVRNIVASKNLAARSARRWLAKRSHRRDSWQYAETGGSQFHGFEKSSGSLRSPLAGKPISQTNETVGDIQKLAARNFVASKNLAGCARRWPSHGRGHKQFHGNSGCEKFRL
jgi:hypothetical protein